MKWIHILLALFGSLVLLPGLIVSLPMAFAAYILGLYAFRRIKADSTEKVPLRISEEIITLKQHLQEIVSKQSARLTHECNASQSVSVEAQAPNISDEGVPSSSVKEVSSPTGTASLENVSQLEPVHADTNEMYKKQSVAEFAGQLNTEMQFTSKKAFRIVGTEAGTGSALGGETGVVIISGNEKGPIYGVVFFSNGEVLQLFSEDDYYEFFGSILPEFFKDHSVYEEKIDWSAYSLENIEDGLRELFAGLQSLADDPDLQEDAFSDFSYENESVIAKSDSRLFLEDEECDARGFWYLCHDQADVLISSRGISFVAYSSDDGEGISHEAPLEKAHSTVYDCLFGACFEEVDGFQQSMVLLRSKNCPPY